MQLDALNFEPSKTKTTPLQSNNGPSKEKMESKLEDEKLPLVFDREVKFTLHEATNRYIVNVIDLESGKVIRSFPSEKLLDILASIIANNQRGLLVDAQG
jgi:uncharacterized FlaG/YvyC family protein